MTAPQTPPQSAAATPPPPRPSWLEVVAIGVLPRDFVVVPDLHSDGLPEALTWRAGEARRLIGTIQRRSPTTVAAVRLHANDRRAWSSRARREVGRAPSVRPASPSTRWDPHGMIYVSGCGRADAHTAGARVGWALRAFRGLQRECRRGRRRQRRRRRRWPRRSAMMARAAAAGCWRHTSATAGAAAAAPGRRSSGWSGRGPARERMPTPRAAGRSRDDSGREFDLDCAGTALITRSGRPITKYGLGGSLSGRQTKELAPRALELGVNYFFFYSLGPAVTEYLKGVALLCSDPDKRADLFIASGSEARDADAIGSRLRAALEVSGKHGPLDAFYLEYVAPGEDMADVEAALQTMATWKRENKLR
eukprot:scaffold582_cov385-Prasinococcus_capsulatus_cf.AAC.1